MSNRIITISRESGSGIRTIGKKAAEKMEIERCVGSLRGCFAEAPHILYKIKTD